MTDSGYQDSLKRKVDSMLAYTWQHIDAGLKAGRTPEDIAEWLASKGFWGFNTNRIDTNDIYRLWHHAVECGLTD